MTKINKLVMSGFKSFANKTELLFGDTVNCVLGPNGNGKCVTGDTQVSLADGTLVAIKVLIESKEKTTIPKVLDDGIMIDGDGTSVLCLNLDTLQLEAKPIQAYVKRTSPEKLVKITTRSGRTITSTSHHPLFILREGRVVSVRADELAEGTKIAVPRKMDVKPASKIFYELLDLIHSEDGLYVPWSEDIKAVLQKAKNGTWNELAAAAGISPVALKSFIIDKQAMNFAFLVKLLRSVRLSDENIIHLTQSIKTKTSSKLCRIPWANSPQFARLLGYLLAEGRIAPESNQVWFTNGTEEIVVDYIELFQRVFGDPVIAREYKPNAWDVIAFNKAALILLSKFGMPLVGGTARKIVAPLFFSHSTEVEVSHLLNGLYCGDGYVSKEIIEITTKSTQLCAGIQMALTRLGILFQTKDVVKIATNSGFEGTYKSIRIYGEPNIRAFAEQISLVHQEKRARIAALLGKKSNPNCDLIEANGLIHTVTRQLGVNVKKMRKTHPKLDAYCYNQCTPSRAGIQQILTAVFNSGEQSEELMQLQRLAHSNIYWDEIEALEVVSASEKWVYDLCVDKHHNFVANNIFVHNSNVLDALCFVLGRASSKSLRAEKASHLIFDGGKKKKPADKGEVHVYFDNADKLFPVDTPEVKVSRIIRKNGQSVYKINDKTNTRSEVLDLLSAARIDPDGYNIILQGDITRFVEMSPIERRQMVEEISGISVYEERKHKALLELEKVEQKLNDADIILNERKTHLKELKKDRDQALKFKEMKDNVDSTKATYVHIHMEKKNAVKEKLDTEVSALKEKLAKLEGQIGQHKSNVREKKESIDRINREIEQKGEVEQVKLSKEIENMRVSLEKQKARVVMLKDSLSKIGQRKHALDKDTADIDANIEDIREQLKKQTQHKAALEKDLAGLEDKIAAFKKKNKIDTLGDVELDIEASDKAIEHKQEEIQKIRQQQQDLLREKDKIDFQLQTIDEQVKKVAQVDKENQKQMAELRDKKERFKKTTLELNGCLDRDSALSAEVANVRQEQNALQQEKAKLEARHASTQERIGGDIAVKKILELKKKKSGIYGTIAELGRVDKKYSLALEVAAGPRLLSIVVEDDKTAAECIHYLKENKFGIATFIPLNKIQAPAVRAEVTAFLKKDGVHDLCVNVVSFDSRFTKAFQYVFGDTLVVDNLDVARGLGIGKARMVTLDGDLADHSGVMRGGYHHQRKVASFADQDVEGQLSDVEEKLDLCDLKLQKLMREKTTQEQKIIAFRKEKLDLEGDVVKLEKLLHLGGDDLDATKRQKEQLVGRQEAIDKQLQEVQERVSVLNKELAASKSAKEQLKLKVSQLRSPQLLAEMHAFDEARQQVKAQIADIQNEIRNLDVRITTMLVPEKQRIEQLLKGHDKEHHSFTSELGQLKVTIDSDQEQLAAKEKSQRAFFSAYKDLFHTRDELNSEVTAAENAIEKLRDSSRKIEIEMNNESLKLAALASELAGLQTQLDQLKNARILRGKSEEELKADLGRFEHMLANMSAVNMKALEIYEQVEVEFGKLVGKKETLLKEKDDVISLMAEIESKKKDQFMRTFDELNTHFREKFASLTNKGKAFLNLENKEKPFEAGLDIRINTTGKRFMDIRGLSGGEKSMTALAFYFAVQEHEPHSFYVMDEVDAALDKHNSERLAQLIRQYCKTAQYIVVSHNDSLISEADYLYGVSMDEFGTSKVVSLKV